MIILTDNKSVTRFFQTKIIPLTLWYACDYVIQFNFTIAHLPCKNNTAVNYMSRLEICTKEKLLLRIREDISWTPIELHVQLAGVTEEDQIFYTDDDEKTEEQIWLLGTTTMAIEQQRDIILQQLRLKLQKEHYSETIFQQDPRYRHYCSQLDRLSVTTTMKQAAFNTAKRCFRNIL